MVQESSTVKKAIIVVDMQNDNVGRPCKDIIPNIALLIKNAREKNIPVIFACDSRYPDDFMFTKRGMKRHAIRGTEGAKVIAALQPAPNEIVIEKRMLSGFFGSELDFTLRQKEIKQLIVTGVSTTVCLFKTVLDAFELGYEVIVPADCCAATSPEDQKWGLEFFRRWKMLRANVQEVIEQL